MKFLKHTILPIFLSGTWISISEYIRNDIFLKEYWSDHYDAMNVVFPYELVNGAIWTLWSFLFAIVIHVVAKRFDFLETLLLTWFGGFVLMWMVVWNLGVLPTGILYYAIPLSIVEVFVAVWIMKRLQGKRSDS